MNDNVGSFYGVTVRLIGGVFYFIPTIRFKFVECSCWDIELIIGNFCVAFVKRCLPPNPALEKLKEFLSDKQL